MAENNVTVLTPFTGVIQEFVEQEIFDVILEEQCHPNSTDVNCAPHGDSSKCYIRYKPSLHIAGVIIASLIWITNALVVYLFARNRTLRRAASNYLLFSLSLIDFLSGVGLAMFLLPYFYLHMAGCKNLRDKFGLYYYMATGQLFTFLFLASIGHLLALSSERVISLFWALNYEKIVRKYRVWIVCVAIWIWGLVLSSVQLTWQNFNSIHTQDESERVEKYDKIFSLVSFVSFAAIPALILVAQYSSMFVLIKKLVRNSPGAIQTRRSLKERKALIVYCAMFVSYVLLVFPYFTLRIVIEYVEKLQWERMPVEIPESALLLRFIVSSVNPLLYTLYKNDFRKALVRAWKFSRMSSCANRRLPRQSADIHRLDDGALAGETEMTLIQRRHSDTIDVGKVFRRFSGAINSGSFKLRRQNSTNGTAILER